MAAQEPSKWHVVFGVRDCAYAVSVRRASARSGTIEPDAGRRSPRLPMGIQVVLAAAVLLAIVTASLVAAILVVRHIDNDETSLNRRDAAYGQALTSAALAENAIGSASRTVLQGGDPSSEQRVDGAARRAEAALDTASSSATNSAQRAAIDDLRGQFGQWLTAVRRDLATYDRGDRARALADSSGSTLALGDTLDDSMIHAQELSTASIQAAASRIASESSRSVKILLAALVAALAAGAIVTYWLVRTIARPLYRIVEFLAPRW